MDKKDDFLKRDLEEQKNEMDKYKWIRSEEVGHDVGKTVYMEWILKFAEIWRKEHPFPW